MFVGAARRMLPPGFRVIVPLPKGSAVLVAFKLCRKPVWTVTLPE